VRVAERAGQRAHDHRDVAWYRVLANDAGLLRAAEHALGELEHPHSVRSPAHRLGPGGENFRERTVVRLDPCALADEVLEGLQRIGLVKRFERQVPQPLEALRREGLHQVFLGGEVPVDGADAHARVARDVFHPRVETLARHAAPRRLDDPLAIAPRVDALRPFDGVWRPLDGGHVNRGGWKRNPDSGTIRNRNSGSDYRHASRTSRRSFR
jgi:hypothetical protein